MRGSNPNRIKEFRQAKGWTAQQLADAIGSSQGAVSRLENGKMKLSLPWLERIAFALGVRVVDLLDHDGDFTWAHVIGHLKVVEPPMIPGGAGTIPVPSLHTFDDGDQLQAFMGNPAKGGYVIVKPVTALDRNLIGWEFVLLMDAKSEGEPWDRLSFLVLEESSSGPGFLRSYGDPAKRWLPWGDPSILARWLIVASITPASRRSASGSGLD